jgi:hypothetical protein
VAGGTTNRSAQGRLAPQQPAGDLILATLKINGETRTYEAPDDTPLLWVIGNNSTGLSLAAASARIVLDSRTRRFNPSDRKILVAAACSGRGKEWLVMLKALKQKIWWLATTLAGVSQHGAVGPAPPLSSSPGSLRQ